MPERRSSLVVRAMQLVGAEQARVEDPADGWPARVDIRTGAGQLPCDVFIGPVGHSHRGRDAVERRFQNPLVANAKPGAEAGKPIMIGTGRHPLLLGLWEEGARPLLVVADPLHRAYSMTRYSIFLPLSLLVQGLTTGWAEQDNSDGERLTAFVPELLPVFIETQRATIRLRPEDMASVVEAAGLTEDHDPNALARARRVASHLVRRKAFSKEVCRAYAETCAMCGFDFSLVVGAHIYPASAPASPDSVWNGLALCHNHHAAFDAHRVWVDPESRELKLHPGLVSEANVNAACEGFVRTTYARLRLPENRAHTPKPEMFTQRYTFFPKKYEWL